VAAQGTRRFVAVRQAVRQGFAALRAPRREAPAPAEEERAPEAQTDLWNEPVPLMKDRDGHLHLLL
jgi:hypothetical protein